MTLTHRPYVGHEVVCDGTGCKATTATAAPPRYRRSPQTAEAAAAALGWLRGTVASQTVWVCPRHQRWDRTLHAWVLVPYATRVHPRDRNR